MNIKPVQAAQSLRPINHAKLISKDPTLITRFKNQLEQEVVIYEHPNYGDEHTLLGVIGEVAFDTGFYDTGDFYENSDYNPIEKDGNAYCYYEYEAKFDDAGSEDTSFINYDRGGRTITALDMREMPKSIREKKIAEYAKVDKAYYTSAKASKDFYSKESLFNKKGA